jgi:hypothetical protein
MPVTVTYEESEDGLLIGAESGNVSVALSVPDDSEEDVEEALRAAYQELRHTTRLRGGSR